MLKVVSLLIMAFSFSACAQTTYTSTGKDKLGPHPFERRVKFHKTDALYTMAPDCIVIWSNELAIKKSQLLLVETAIFRHLSVKVDRVISPRQRDRIALTAGLDLKNPKDKKYFSKSQRCGFELNIMSALTASDYLLVWSQNKVSLDLSLRKITTGVELWRAQHTGKRGHGGIALTPLSIGMNAFEASRSSADRDELPSIIDDTLRRMFVTLPDFRIN